MIRVYLDWNVISKLKTPEFADALAFIKKNKKRFLFVYSPTHFNDLMKSYRPDNPYFQQDIDMLSFLTDKHLMRWSDKGMEMLFATPQEFFTNIKDQPDFLSTFNFEKMVNDLDEEPVNGIKVGSLIKNMLEIIPSGLNSSQETNDLAGMLFPNLPNNATMWDIVVGLQPLSKSFLSDKEYYKKIRKSVNNKGFALCTDAGNWEESDVLNNIESYLKSLGTASTYREFINTSLKDLKNSDNIYTFFTTAYLMLDIIGYKREKLRKPTDNFLNIFNDAEHAFYASYCEVFVADDNNLRIKASILLRESDLSTQVISPKEIISTLTSLLDNDQDKLYSDKIFDYLNPNSIVDYKQPEDGNAVSTYIVELDRFYFDFFNFAVYEHFPNQAMVVTFKRVFQNHSRAVYFTESEVLFDKVASYFGLKDNNQEELKSSFAYGPPNQRVQWKLPNGFVYLEKSNVTSRPELIFVLNIKERDEK